MDPLTRKKRFFYEDCADATLYFHDGKNIRVNKTMLSFHSPVFFNMFFCSSPRTVIVIDDFDSKTFKIFLDCLLGLEDYSTTNAVLIYPIAHKFKVDNSLKNCLEKLKWGCYSSKIDENTSCILNLAISYNCKDLTDTFTRAALKDDWYIMNLLENERSYFLLEPESMLMVVKKINVMNSFFVEKIFKWGENYLMKRNKSLDSIRSFFSEHRILPYIIVNAFESVESIFQFHNKISKGKLFRSEEILHYLENVVLRSSKLPKKSLWVIKKKGEILTEKINLQLLTNSETSAGAEKRLKFGTNDIIGCNLFDIHKNGLANCEYYCLFKMGACKNEFRSKGSQFIIQNRSQKGAALVAIKDSQVIITSLEVKYTFNVDCRILKTSLENIRGVVDDSKLYFTCGIEFLK